MIDLPSASYEGGFVCDEFRTENNGKLLAIGIYTGGILLESVPTDVGIAIAFRVTPKRQGLIDFKLRVLYDGSPSLEMEGQLQATRKRSNLMATPRFITHIEKYGELEVQIGEGESDWLCLFKVAVDPTTNSSSSVSEPPSSQS